MSHRELTEITVVGDDDTGLVARVTTLLFERAINVKDIDQAVRDDVFRMTMHVDTSGMESSRDALRSDLRELGDDLGVDVRVRFPADRETRRIAVMVTKESQCLERLCEAAAAGDLDALRIAAHTLKSNARDFGAMALSSVCATLEAECRTGAASEPQAQVERIAQELDRARTALSGLAVRE